MEMTEETDFFLILIPGMSHHSLVDPTSWILHAFITVK
jgi:hypothetical protein